MSQFRDLDFGHAFVESNYSKTCIYYNNNYFHTILIHLTQKLNIWFSYSMFMLSKTFNRVTFHVPVKKKNFKKRYAQVSMGAFISGFGYRT